MSTPPTDPTPEEGVPQMGHGQPNRSRAPLYIGLGVGVAALLIATLIAVPLVSGLSQGASDSPEEGMGPSPASEPDDTWVGVNQPALDGLGIGPEALASGDELAKEFLIKHLTEWINYGATPENSALADDPSNTDQDAFIANLCEESDRAFIESLLVKGWESNPALVDWVNEVKATHAVTLKLYFATDSPRITPENIHPFILEYEYSSIPSFTINADGSVTLETIAAAQDNRDENTVGENPNYTITGIGTNIDTLWTFVVEDGKVKLSNVEPKAA